LALRHFDWKGRKSKASEKDADDVVHSDAKAPVEDDDAAKDTEEEDEKSSDAKPDGEESARSPIGAASKSAEDPDAAHDAHVAKDPSAEEREVVNEDSATAEPDETAREDDASEKPAETPAATDGDEYQWEISCCGVDIPLTK
jgi:hypothetical protein